MVMYIYSSYRSLALYISLSLSLHIMLIHIYILYTVVYTLWYLRLSFANNNIYLHALHIYSFIWIYAVE